mgnify:CR=1 FL=1
MTRPRDRRRGRPPIPAGQAPAQALALALVAAAVLLPATAAADADAPGPDTPPPTLLLIDIQEFYYPGGGWALADPEPAGRHAGRLLARFREHGWPVIHVRHDHEPGGAIHAHVAPRDGEPVLTKRRVNAFVGTDLQQRLEDLAARRLVIAGMQTHMCVEAAVRAAADLGYQVTVAADACATRDVEHGGHTVSAADVHAATLATLAAYATVTDTASLLADLAP